MGWYDDDGNYHRDAYDDDHLDLEDIGGFLEANFHPRNSPRARKRREIREKRANTPRRIQESQLYSVCGAAIGIGIAWLIGCIFGHSSLLFFILTPLCSVLALLWKVVRVDEMTPDPKEIGRMILQSEGIRLCILGIAVYLVFLLIS